MNNWDKWLGQVHGEYLQRIRRSVEEICAQDEPLGGLAFYTPHGPEHFQAVEDNIHKLIPDEASNELDERERFFLLASAWLHDLGMLRSVAREVWGTDLSDYEIREHHHVTSAKFIVNNYRRCGLEDTDKEFIATLCPYHRRKLNIDKCPDEWAVGVDKKRYRLRLLAAYLRLADSLDIGAYRTPTPAYALCLSYNIPDEYKFHWIKNRLISGIHINPNDHKICIDFISPDLDREFGPEAAVILKDKLNHIVSIVLDDLRDELTGVMHLLIRSNISYFLDIESKTNIGYVAEQMLDDLSALIANYDIMVHPSASRLLEMILSTVANVTGFHLSRTDSPKKFLSHRQPDHNRIVTDLKDFFTKVRLELINTRPCHLGLTNLLDSCEKLMGTTLKAKNYDKFINQINELYKEHHNTRTNIRAQASAFYEHKSAAVETREETKILLYGYSELVIKAICGFRDSVIRYKYPNLKPRDFYNHELESEISRMFQIFVCECQPKTQTGPRDKLMYHDGILYAEALRKRNFHDIILLPDIVVSNILDNFGINMIIVGANGFSDLSFKHSAGHSSVINLGRDAKSRTDSSFPQIILVVSTEKYRETEDEHCTPSRHNLNSIDELNGCSLFAYTDTVSTRSNIWFTQDSNIIRRLCENRIKLLNPREDIIPIRHLDYVISDRGWFPIRGGSNLEGIELDENVRIFLAAQQRNPTDGESVGA